MKHYRLRKKTDDDFIKELNVENFYMAFLTNYKIKIKDICPLELFYR